MNALCIFLIDLKHAAVFIVIVAMSIFQFARISFDSMIRYLLEIMFCLLSMEKGYA